jgi:hypothetical protein
MPKARCSGHLASVGCSELYGRLSTIGSQDIAGNYEAELEQIDREMEAALGSSRE